MNRRDFLNATIAGAGAFFVGAGTKDSTASPRVFDPYEQVPLGNSGLTVSRICQGTGMRGGARESNHTRMGQKNFETLIRGGYERGIRFYDLADLYGTHTPFSKAVEGFPRDSYAIATKIWFRGGGIPEDERPDADIVVNRFLREMKTDYIDLLLLHCTVSGDWPSEQRRQMDILKSMKEQGKIKALGTSCHSLEALSAAAEESWVDSVHTRINPYGASMDGSPEEVVPILQRHHANGKGVVGMKLIGEGRFRDDEEKKNESVKFVLGLGCVDVLNVGFESLAEVDDFAARVQKVPRDI